MNNPHYEYFSELTSAEVLSKVTGRTLIWPIGGIEQHGPHLPLNVDSIIPEAFAKALAGDVNGMLLPLQPISTRSLPQSGGGLHFPGTLFVDGQNFIHYIRDTLRALSCLPFQQLVIINGHYENEAFIFEAIDQLRALETMGQLRILAFSWWSMVHTPWIESHLPEFPGWHAEHAGITETSLMLYLRPDLVRPIRLDHQYPPRCGVYQCPPDPQASSQGILSKTSHSSTEIGRLLFCHVQQQIKDFVMAQGNDGNVSPQDESGWQEKGYSHAETAIAENTNFPL